jgi:hypothetical protein
MLIIYIYFLSISSTFMNRCPVRFYCHFCSQYYSCHCVSRLHHKTTTPLIIKNIQQKVSSFFLLLYTQQRQKCFFTWVLCLFCWLCLSPAKPDKACSHSPFKLHNLYNSQIPFVISVVALHCFGLSESFFWPFLCAITQSPQAFSSVVLESF